MQPPRVGMRHAVAVLAMVAETERGRAAGRVTEALLVALFYRTIPCPQPERATHRDRRSERFHIGQQPHKATR